MHGVRADGEHTAARIEGHLAMNHLIAPVGVAHDGFRATGNPFHRAADTARRPQHQRILRIGRALESEAAAHIVGDHANARLGHVQHVLSEHVAHAVRVLRAVEQRIGVVA